MKGAGASEAEMLDLYRSLHSSLSDDLQLISWFRDQVLHPYETQHTLRELIPVLEASGMQIVSTSINGFSPFGSIDQLCDAEPQLEKIDIERLKQGRFRSRSLYLQQHCSSS
jgi:hypothetical protein